MAARREDLRRRRDATPLPLGSTVTLAALACRGHGTQVVDDQKLVATVCGVVEKVNKLMTVRVLHSRYSAEIGDVVVGRVTEVRGPGGRAKHSRMHANAEEPHLTVDNQ